MVKECSVAQRHLASENGNACRKKLICAGVAARTDFAGIIAPLGNGNGYQKGCVAEIFKLINKECILSLTKVKHAKDVPVFSE
jgi:hypothetical protein